MGSLPRNGVSAWRLDGGLVLTTPRNKMTRSNRQGSNRRRLENLIRGLERVGFKILLAKPDSKYHVTIWSPQVFGFSSVVSFAGSAWQVEKILKAISLGYAVGWESRKVYDSQRPSCEGDAL